MEDRKEAEIRQHLEERLEAGEELLAYTKGATSGFLSTRSIYLGLTPRRLLLLPLEYGKPSSQVLSICRESITSLRWSSLWSRLRVRLPRGELDISCSGGRWKRLVKELVDSHDETPIAQRDPSLRAQTQLEQAEALYELGLTASAQETIRQLELAGEFETSSAALGAKISERRLALRVGTGFLLANVGLAILFAAITIVGNGRVNPALFISAIIDTAVGINLWRGRAHQWVALAVFRAVAGLVFFGLMSLFQGAILSLIAQTALCGSLVLVLAGKASRVKTLAAVGVYVVGYLGVLLASVVVEAATALLCS